MFSYKFKCRKCRRQDDASFHFMLYTKTCSCGNKFRMCDADFRMSDWSRWWRNLPGSNPDAFAADCPYCEQKVIPIGLMREDGSFHMPARRCPQCCHDLPGPITNQVNVDDSEMFDPTDAFSPIWNFSEIVGDGGYEAAVKENGGKDLSRNKQFQLLEKQKNPVNPLTEAQLTEIQNIDESLSNDEVVELISQIKRDPKYQFIPPVNPTEAQSTEIQSPMDMSKLSTKLQKGSIYDPNSSTIHFGQLLVDKRWHDYINHPDFHKWSIHPEAYPKLQAKVNNWLQQGWITPEQHKTAQARITHAENMPRNEL